MGRVIRCRTGEVCRDYPSYLRSKHWKDVKRRYYSKYGYYCKSCNWKRNLQLHHRTYKNIGNERLTDLESLCVKCHRMEHGLIKLSQPLKRNKRKKWSWKFKLFLIVGFIWVGFKMWFWE